MNAPTILPEEIARFNRLADTWWDESGPMWPLHRLNALRTPFILDHVSRHFGLQPGESLASLSFLDVGCGAGILSESIARTGARVHGIDVADRNIEIARQHTLVSGLDIRYDTLAPADLPAGSQYDVVLNMEVVEHVDNLADFMKSCAGLTRPGGLMIVATINRTLYSLVTAKLGAEYILGWLPRGTHDWRRFVTPDECFALLREAGFGFREVTGVGVNPMTRHMYQTRYLGGNYMLVAVRRGGKHLN